MLHSIGKILFSGILVVFLLSSGCYGYSASEKMNADAVTVLIESLVSLTGFDPQVSVGSAGNIHCKVSQKDYLEEIKRAIGAVKKINYSSQHQEMARSVLISLEKAGFDISHDDPARSYSNVMKAQSEWEMLMNCLSEEARFTKDADGVITDSQTNLQWYCGKGGYTWYKADAWAKGLSVGGGGWTLATRVQLRGLKGEGFNSRLFTSGYSWSSEQGPTQQTAAYLGDCSTAWFVGIDNDYQVWLSRSGYNHGDVLAVRSRR